MNSQVAESRLGANRLRSLSARLAPGAGGFFSWWGRTLASWLPLRARQALGVDRGRLLLQVDGDSVHLRLQQGSEVRDLAVLPSLADLLIERVELRLELRDALDLLGNRSLIVDRNPLP